MTRLGPGRVALIMALSTSLALALTACGGKRGERGGRGGGPSGPVPVMAARVTTADVPLALKAIGTVAASASVSLRAQVAGQILSTGFTPGQPVRRGQVLYQLDPAPFRAALAEARATRARDAAQAAQGRLDAARLRALAAQGFVPRAQAEQATSLAAAQAATLQADDARIHDAALQLGYATIRAPIAGVAGDRLLDPGNLVRAGDATPLVVINQITPAQVRFAVPQQDVDRVRRFQREAPLAVVVTPRGGQPHAGTLRFLDNAIDPSTGTLALRAELPNADAALLPGQFVDVTLTLTTEPGRVVAPAEAILPSQDGHLAYVVDGEQVHERRVRVARLAGGLAVIADGLKAGERVVTDGTLQLTEGATVTLRDSLVPPSPSPGERRGRRRG